MKIIEDGPFAEIMGETGINENTQPPKDDSPKIEDEEGNFEES